MREESERVSFIKRNEGRRIGRRWKNKTEERKEHVPGKIATGSTEKIDKEEPKNHDHTGLTMTA